MLKHHAVTLSLANMEKCCNVSQHRYCLRDTKFRLKSVRMTEENVGQATLDMIWQGFILDIT